MVMSSSKLVNFPGYKPLLNPWSLENSVGKGLSKRKFLQVDHNFQKSRTSSHEEVSVGEGCGYFWSMKLFTTLQLTQVQETI